MLPSSSDVLVGSRICILPGRCFDAFRGGDTGRVVGTRTAAQSCQVLFDGQHSPRCVAFKHFRLLSASYSATQSSSLQDLTKGAEAHTGSAEIPCDSPPPRRHGLETTQPTSDVLRVDGRSVPQSSSVAMGSFDSEGAVALLGPICSQYDGLSKWKGCALASDGNLYCAPYSTTTVLIINPTEQTLAHIEDVGICDCKWSGVAAGIDGLLYCAPCNASTVLVIDPKTQSISHLGSVGDGQYKWSGIVAASDGLLYCAPSRASSVLVINPKTKTLSHIEGAGSGGSKWSGIVEGPDGLLYCAPSMATAVLVVDAKSQCLRRLEGALDGTSFKYKWSGLARGCDGLLYCSPYNASSVLVIDPKTQTLNYIGGAGSGDCKWSGIAPGLDGRLYCVPSRAPMVLVIGLEAGSLDFDFNAVGKGHSKWSGLCVGLDGWLYCVPYNASNVLGIKGGSGHHTQVPTSPDRLSHLVRSDEAYADEKTEVAVAFGAILEMRGKERVKGYRELCRCWHPDKHPENLERATVVFQFLQHLHERFGAFA